MQVNTLALFLNLNHPPKCTTTLSLIFLVLVLFTTVDPTISQEGKSSTDNTSSQKILTDSKWNVSNNTIVLTVPIPITYQYTNSQLNLIEKLRKNEKNRIFIVNSYGFQEIEDDDGQLNSIKDNLNLRLKRNVNDIDNYYDDDDVNVDEKSSKSNTSATLLILRLAQCRANCLSMESQTENFRTKFPKRRPFQGVFLECWDYCSKLEVQIPDSTICNLQLNPKCMIGCQKACEFHKNIGLELGKHKIAIKVEPSLIFSLNPPYYSGSSEENKGNKVLKWPSISDEPNSNSNTNNGQQVVYCLVQHVSQFSWLLIGQTIRTSTEISLESSLLEDISKLRVLAVNSHEGLVKVFSFPQKSPENEENTANDWQLEVQEEAVGVNEISSIHNTNSSSEKPEENVEKSEKPEENVEESEKPEENISPENSDLNISRVKKGPWNLRKVSMVHQKFLVLTEVSWDRPKVQRTDSKIDKLEKLRWNSTTKSDQNRAKSRVLNYLLTWDIFGGVLKGNLVTDTTSVAISLLPDTVYVVQVGLLKEGLEPTAEALLVQDGTSKYEDFMKSELLFLNTSRATYPTDSKLHNNRVPLRSFLQKKSKSSKKELNSGSTSSSDEDFLELGDDAYSGGISQSSSSTINGKSNANTNSGVEVQVVHKENPTDIYLISGFWLVLIFCSILTIIIYRKARKNDQTLLLPEESQTWPICFCCPNKVSGGSFENLGPKLTGSFGHQFKTKSRRNQDYSTQTQPKSKGPYDQIL